MGFKNTSRLNKTSSKTVIVTVDGFPSQEFLTVQPRYTFLYRLLYSYSASRVFFGLPRLVGKRKKTLPTAWSFLELPLIQGDG